MRESPILDAILADMRRQIVLGRWPAGSRLPTQGEFIQQYCTSKATIQRVYDTLFEEGLIAIRGSAGAFVLDDPFQVYRYGVVFPSTPSRDNAPGTFDHLLETTCRTIYQSGQYHFRLYHGVTGHSDEEGYRQAAEDIQAFRLAGLLLPHMSPLLTTPLLTLPGVPRVVLSDPMPNFPFPILLLDKESYIGKAVDFLQRRGRRRIALLAFPGETSDDVRRVVEARGMTMQPFWALQLSVAHPRSVISPVRLLMGYPVQERPDGLIIWDDVFVAPALTALADAGCRVGEDVDVVAHCNFPRASTDTLPIKRLGTYVPEVVTTALRLLEQQRRNLAVPATVAISAIYDDEVALAARACADALETRGATAFPA